MTLIIKLVRCCTIERMKSPRYLPVLIAVMALALTTPVQLSTYRFQRFGQQTEMVSQPVWPSISVGRPVTQVMEADLDGDGQMESLNLKGGEAKIEQGGQVAWRSPETWQVSQALIGDLDGDGQPEVDLLVWRPFRPWPVDRFLPYGGRIERFQDSQGRSCQLILIAWRGGAFQERWAGSALAEPLRAFAVADLDGDGRQELVALETRYDDPPFVPARAVSIWEWNGFGFSLLSRRTGAFRQMVLYDSPDLEPFLVIQR
jgi:hypothetical protein